MGRIEDKIAQVLARKEKALAVFLTGGYPTRDATPPLVRAVCAGGADIVEIGMPFSDPMADGPVIQESSAVALRNGTTLESILADVRCVRQASDVPVVLMGYLNPIMRYGLDRFFTDAVSSGVDGLILPEVPLEESDRFAGMLERSGLAQIMLATPTASSERLHSLDLRSSGFLYCVSHTGVTGTGGATASFEYLRRVRKAAVHNKVLVGFGISTPDDARKYADEADGVVVGSALLRKIGREGTEGIESWVAGLKGVLVGKGN